DASCHCVEDRAGRLGAQKPQAEPVGFERQRIVELDRRERVLVEVLPRLVEELARQREMALVDQLDLTDVTDVRHAVAIARRDDAGDDAVEATVERFEPDHSRPDCSGILTPAIGPGVCANTCLMSRSIAWHGQMPSLSVFAAGCPTNAR